MSEAAHVEHNNRQPGPDCAVRPADVDEFGEVLDMAGVFWSETPYPEPYDPEYFGTVLEHSHAQGLLLVLDIDDELCGFVAGVSAPLLGNGAYRMAIALAHWTNDEGRGHGHKLVQGFKAAARMTGNHYASVTSRESHSPTKSEALYHRLGWRPTERTFITDLAR